MILHTLISTDRIALLFSSCHFTRPTLHNRSGSCYSHTWCCRLADLMMKNVWQCLLRRWSLLNLSCLRPLLKFPLMFLLERLLVKDVCVFVILRKITLWTECELRRQQSLRLNFSNLNWMSSCLRSLKVLPERQRLSHWFSTLWTCIWSAFVLFSTGWSGFKRVGSHHGSLLIIIAIKLVS